MLNLIITAMIILNLISAVMVFIYIFMTGIVPEPMATILSCTALFTGMLAFYEDWKEGRI